MKNGVAMSEYSHLTAEERDRLAGLKADDLALQAIAKALSRAAGWLSAWRDNFGLQRCPRRMRTDWAQAKADLQH